jgi:hypothetical protein
MSNYRDILLFALNPLQAGLFFHFEYLIDLESSSRICMLTEVMHARLLRSLMAAKGECQQQQIQREWRQETPFFRLEREFRSAVQNFR